VPVIAPSLPSISELLNRAPVGLLYDPADPEALEETLRQAANIRREELACFRRNALAKARDWDWSSLRKEIGAFFAAAISLAHHVETVEMREATRFRQIRRRQASQ